MSAFRAEKLVEVSRVVAPHPLSPDDPYYADLSKARHTKELRKMHVYLENCAQQEGCYVSAAFIGHRGSGKTTELKRLEGEIAHLFTCLHLELDPSLEDDCDYTDLFLWLVTSLLEFFQAQGLSLDASLVREITDWFAERSIENVEERKKEIELAVAAEVSAKAGANFGIFGYSLQLLTRLQSRLTGGQTQRKVVRERIQTLVNDLIKKVNTLLAHARDVLRAAGRPDRLLIVQDNLDRLYDPDNARRLFRDNGDKLARIEADCIWTAPINARLAPFNLGLFFPNRFTMPTIKVHDQSGAPVQAGIDGLVALVERRINLELVFASRDVVTYLAEQSGGSVRDLLRFIGQAQLAAQVDELDVIEMDSAREAVKKVRFDLQGALVPGDAYYPLLATIFYTKRDAGLSMSVTTEQATSNQYFYSQLLVNGMVLEYNGDESWCDVHPVIHEIRAFQDACKQYRKSAA